MTTVTTVRVVLIAASVVNMVMSGWVTRKTISHYLLSRSSKSGRAMQRYLYRVSHCYLLWCAGATMLAASGLLRLLEHLLAAPVTGMLASLLFAAATCGLAWSRWRYDKEKQATPDPLVAKEAP